MDERSAAVARATAWRLVSKRPTVLWLTGLSGAGKSTIASAAALKLQALGYHCVVLDGDEMRQGLCQGLGFSDAERSENIRRVAEVARLFSQNGAIVLAALITPQQRQRTLARHVIGTDAFVEVFVDAPLAVAEARDPKGLYRRARAGQLPGFTGIDARYEPPLWPHIKLNTADSTCEQAVQALLGYLYGRGVVS